MKKMLVLGLVFGLTGLWLANDAEACKKPLPKCPPRPCATKHHGHHHSVAKANANATAYAYSGGGYGYHERLIIIKPPPLPPKEPPVSWLQVMFFTSAGKNYLGDSGGKRWILKEGEGVMRSTSEGGVRGTMSRDKDSKCGCRWFQEGGRVWF